MTAHPLRHLGRALVAFIVCCGGPAAPAAAQTTPATASETAALETVRQEIETLRQQYEARIAALEERIARLEAAAAPAPDAAPVAPRGPEPAPPDERAALEDEVAALLAEAPAPAGGPEPSQPEDGRRFVGGERSLQSLNPEISVTGDVFGTVANTSGDPESNQFRFSEFEVAFQSALDPFSLVKAFIVQEEGEFGVEEAYVDWTSLPAGLGLRVGRFRNDWGKINRYHQHALAQADRPLVHQVIFGEEGLSGLGASVSWLPPAFLGDYHEVWLQVTNDENDVAFSGRGFDDPVFLVHETNYWDLSNAAYIEVGLSAATGVNDLDGRGRTQVYGVDWNYNWSPPAEALYTGLELRGEWLWSHRETPAGIFDTHGAYTYATYKLNRQWFAGVRGDWTQLPGDTGRDLFGVSPYLEWWQSEWARIRLQYEFASRRLEEPGEREHRAFFQVTWAIGPHKHEKY